MDKDKVTEVSFIRTDVDMKDILRTTKRMEKDWSWMKMETLNYNILKKINLFTLFLKVT
jgi:hypothetical protein